MITRKEWEDSVPEYNERSFTFEGEEAEEWIREL